MPEPMPNMRHLVAGGQHALFGGDCHRDRQGDRTGVAQQFERGEIAGWAE